jgi:hypothetical protein
MAAALALADGAETDIATAEDGRFFAWPGWLLNGFTAGQWRFDRGCLQAVLTRASIGSNPQRYTRKRT